MRQSAPAKTAAPCCRGLVPKRFIAMFITGRRNSTRGCSLHAQTLRISVGNDHGSLLPKSKILTAIAWVLLPKSEIWTTLHMCRSACQFCTTIRPVTVGADIIRPKRPVYGVCHTVLYAQIYNNAVGKGGIKKPARQKQKHTVIFLLQGALKTKTCYRFQRTSA